MKKSFFLLILFFAFIVDTYAQSNNAKILIDSYQKGFLTNTKDSVYYQKQFFTALPSNFRSFKSLYGWKDDNTRLALSSIPRYYFDRFFDSKCVDEDAMVKKMVGIAINAVWVPGAISDFQQSSFRYVLTHNKNFVKHLKTLSKKDRASVWAFYFDYQNPIFRKASYGKMVKVVQQNDRAMIPEITEGYNKGEKKWAKNYNGYLKTN